LAKSFCSSLPKPEKLASIGFSWSLDPDGAALSSVARDVRLLVAVVVSVAGGGLELEEAEEDSYRAATRMCWHGGGRDSSNLRA
jgi:hypothetical protein